MMGKDERDISFLENTEDNARGLSSGIVGPAHNWRLKSEVEILYLWDFDDEEAIRDISFSSNIKN